MERFAKKVAAIVADPRNIAARTTYHLRFDFMGSSELECSGGMGLAWRSTNVGSGSGSRNDP
jgi:hypothetical protein